MSVELHRDSLEYVTFPLTAAPVDPATLTHEVAIIDPLGDPTDGPPSDWITVAYVDGLVQVLVRASATAPAGGDITLALGRWRVWWRAQANPEYPSRLIGLVYVR